SSPIKMHNKDVCSPSSKSGFGVGINTADRKQSNTGAFASSSSALTNASLPSLAGNCSNGGEVEALQKENGELRTVKKDLQKNKILSKRITSPIKMHVKNVCSSSSKGGIGVEVDNTAGHMQSDAGAFAFSDLINENQPDAGNCSNKGEAGTDFNMYVIQNDQHTVKTSKEVKALEKDLNLAKRLEILFSSLFNRVY
ncbi:zinc finger CCCH domain-containing protein 15-like, partial [Trifolium medium]|nr:zinc finger CCCH domain-containing protein 15-like [Trifolium medium]